MKVIIAIEEMKEITRRLRSQGKTIGFIPTMGYLHEGHLSLVRQSIKETDLTIASIFVNPTQFGPREDFTDYPRDLNRDIEILQSEGVDCVFSPSQDEMYPAGYKTYVEVHELQERLCGGSRPIHFRGVCTVVLKFFNIVCPDVAFFGQKDAQQAIILRRMVKELNLDVKIEVLPIIRDNDGLALSSRNEYLNSQEKKAALSLYHSLQRAKEKIEEGERRVSILIQEMEKLIKRESLARIDYVEIVDANELIPVKTLKKESLIALAVFVGKTRLIDNIMVEVSGRKVKVKE